MLLLEASFLVLGFAKICRKEVPNKVLPLLFNTEAIIAYLLVPILNPIGTMFSLLFSLLLDFLVAFFAVAAGIICYFLDDDIVVIIFDDFVVDIGGSICVKSLPVPNMAQFLLLLASWL